MSGYSFSHGYKPVPRRGLTMIEAAEFLRGEFPDVPHWTCWQTNSRFHHSGVRKLVGKGHRSGGEVNGWRWSRVACAYPEIAFWDGDGTAPEASDDWVGTVRIQGPDGKESLLFSCLNSMGSIGDWYMASTDDLALLDRFAKALDEHFRPAKRLTILTQLGPDIELDPDEQETIFLPDDLRQDIERQVLGFFGSKEVFSRMRLRHRRGFLFVGNPGTGKTLMLRHLVRLAHRLHRVGTYLLSMTSKTEDEDVIGFFRMAANCAPSLLILEDLDSLTKECKVTRSCLLNQLDGIDRRDGILVIGTTNNPEDVDPALVHRPSRFDRVWRFPLPDQPMRVRYLAWAFDGLDADRLAEIARRTADWSCAYLNELRTTAAMLGMDRTPPSITDEDLERAFDLLAAQFHAGRKNHATEKAALSGFAVSSGI